MTDCTLGAQWSFAEATVKWCSFTTDFKKESKNTVFRIKSIYLKTCTCILLKSENNSFVVMRMMSLPVSCSCFPFLNAVVPKLFRVSMRFPFF